MVSESSSFVTEIYFEMDEHGRDFYSLKATASTVPQNSDTECSVRVNTATFSARRCLDKSTEQSSRGTRPTPGLICIFFILLNILLFDIFPLFIFLVMSILCFRFCSSLACGFLCFFESPVLPP